jgi:hypothetical protein
MTMNLPIENLSPFAHIAQIFCPNVYEQLIDRKEFRLKKTQTSKYLFTNLNILLLCSSISLLCILILLLTGIILSYFTSIRLIILALQQQFNILI